MNRPDWYYDDGVQVGLDFADDAQAASYDERQAVDAVEDSALVARLCVGPDHATADIGCGTGLLATELARRCRLVHAIDISAPMLRATERRAHAAGLDNITTMQAGFLSFQLPAGSLDLVTTKFALHHLTDLWKGVALARVHAALKPGGRLFIRDVVFQCSPANVPEAAESWIDWMMANTGYQRADVATHIREEHSTFDWILEGLIERAGFRILSVEKSLGVYADYSAERLGA